MDKIIFLDIDGVLNRGGTHGEEGMLNNELVPIFKKMLTELPDVKVVISSSWKHNTAALKAILDTVCEFIGTTPYVPMEKTDSTMRRGAEIQAWLDGHEVEKYAIIDDTGTMLDAQFPNLFRTLGHIGLTKKIAEKVIKHFSING